jgi:hypothetical protein
MENETQKARIGQARNLARNLLKKAGVKEPPTSLRTIITHLQKEHVLGVFPDSTLRDGISGMLITVETNLLDEQSERYDEIRYNEKHSWHRKRFTIAHEIGHLLFNTSCNKSFLSFDFIKDPIEVEANQFAAELLIPLASIKKDLKKPDAKVSEIAWRYIVSQEAMGWKISSCNLLGRL